MKFDLVLKEVGIDPQIEIVMDGHNITEHVESIEVRCAADELTTVTLRLTKVEVAVDAEADMIVSVRARP